ncbi:DUF6338 family protein [Actinomadura madurae]|uniref:DUF6338 family protein n=1 Tax=Actinomadura madurae TaxID=1993 RepID=UPI0020D26212|nr:DUF6338 family protein [Actinomadura madurae]MCP9954909.1 DUF6338 family protein [Actinomadura madurae]
MPSNALALAVLIVALAPGFAYHRVYRRRVPGEKRTATEEIVELFCAGALGSFAASLAVLGLAQAVPGLVTLDTLLGGGKELRAHAWAAVLSGALALALSVLSCAAAGVAMGRFSRSGVGQIRPGTLFVRTVTARSSAGPPPLSRRRARRRAAGRGLPAVRRHRRGPGPPGPGPAAPDRLERHRLHRAHGLARRTRPAARFHDRRHPCQLPRTAPRRTAGPQCRKRVPVRLPGRSLGLLKEEPFPPRCRPWTRPPCGCSRP